MGKNWAIAIGINDYSNLRHLKYAEADAKAMGDWFKQEAKFEQVFLFTKDSPDIPARPSSIPTNPTYGHLRRFLRAQFEKPLLQPGDNLWFFFAGHGKREQERDYLMLSDSDPGDVEYTAISIDYVIQRLRKSGADNVILFLDACRDESRSGEGIKGEYKGVVTFYSCSPDQRAYEIDQYHHGSFTYALLEGLKIQGEGNCATVERLEQYLRHRVPQITHQYYQEKQNPYASAEPATKLHLILLPDYATLTDINNLKIDAFQAEAQKDWLLAKQLWYRVNVAARGSDWQAIEAFSRISQRQQQLPISSTTNSKTINTEEKARSSEEDQAKHFTEDLGNGIKLEMIPIPGGKFLMGEGEGSNNNDEKPQHEVTIPPFFMSKYPITQAQYQQVMGNNPSHFQGDDRPVEQVSWDDAVEFCQKLSQQTRTEYRLPTEAEWEYACRSVNSYQSTVISEEISITDWNEKYNQFFHFGEVIPDKLANFRENVRETTPVGQFSLNAFGLYDMHGNVSEWCEDDWHGNYQGAPTDGSARVLEGSSDKVIRGSSWRINPLFYFPAIRNYFPRDGRSIDIGLRIACVAPGTT